MSRHQAEQKRLKCEHECKSFELAWQSKVDQLAEEPATSSGRSSKQQAEEASVCEVIQAGTCGVDQVLILR